VLRFTLDEELAPLVTGKGSIAVDGVSLTVSAIGPNWFEVSLIPETLRATTLGQRAVGEAVNIETDILARHVARLLQFGRTATTERSEQ
jgi:riboflavin synthase